MRFWQIICLLVLCLTACETTSGDKLERIQKSETSQTEAPATAENDDWYKCWDGSEAKLASECPAQITYCWDGSLPEIGYPCPALPHDEEVHSKNSSEIFLCPDGSEADAPNHCPTYDPFCWDGSFAEEATLCPPQPYEMK